MSHKQVLYLSSFGGRDLRQVTQNIMRALMTDDCAADFSLKGAKKKMSFIDTNMFDVVYGKKLHFSLASSLHVDGLRNVVYMNPHNIFSKEAVCSGKSGEKITRADIFPYLENFMKYAPSRLER